MRITIGRDKILLFSYFIAIIMAGSAGLMLSGSWTGEKPLRYIDALFTATSAVCVTGLVTVDTALFTRLGQAIIMTLIQMGGLGIITFATLYVALPRRRISLVSRSMISDYSMVEMEHDPKKIIAAILVSTFSIEITGMLVLHTRFGPRGQPLFVSAFHAVSAFCNAGFSTYSDNLEGFVGDPVVNIVIMGLIISGGIGFLVMSDIVKRLRRQRTHLAYHTVVVLKTTAALILVGAALYFFLEYGGAFKSLTFAQKIMASFFQSVAPRTAGFDTIAQGSLNQPSRLLTIILMFIGASPASTGGGVKTTTFFILMMTAFRYQGGQDTLEYRGRSITGKTVFKAIGVVVKALAIVIVSVILVSIVESGVKADIPLLDVVFEVVSAIGTVGLSVGITPHLESASKLVVILTMFMGRVGLFAMAMPRSGRKIEGYASLPVADVLIG